jgi:hypothetical protein
VHGVADAVVEVVGRVDREHLGSRSVQTGEKSEHGAECEAGQDAIHEISPPHLPGWHATSMPAG